MPASRRWSASGQPLLGPGAGEDEQLGAGAHGAPRRGGRRFERESRTWRRRRGSGVDFMKPFRPKFKDKT
jgi:hypothetical protein